MVLRQRLPWTERPLIINAPMGEQAGANLAIAVTQAGGLGQVGSAGNVNELSGHLGKVEQTIGRHNGLLPVGAGILLFLTNLDAVLPVLQKYKPAVIWLFAARELQDHAHWAQRIRGVTPQAQIWVQVGSVAAALTVADQAKPDVICVQGIDAGGHGFEKGAGIISLFPEVSDALASAGHGSIPLVASGGIVDGRGAAAAFALGAQGVVMGTRFLSAPEAQIHPIYRKAVIAASDGGQNTTRATLFDNLKGPSIWPVPYDGRCIVSESVTDFRAGKNVEEIRRLHAEAVKKEDAGFGVDGKGRVAMWAGTGVGLIRGEQPAGQIVEQVRREVLEVLNKVCSKL